MTYSRRKKKMNLNIMKIEKMRIMQSYSRLPIVIERGSGCYVYAGSRRYLDFTSGLGTAVVGHANHEIAAAISAQAKTMINSSNLYYNEPQVLLAERLAGISGLSKCFFSNSGSEAIEVAIKLSRKNTGKNGIIATINAFHGRTFGALTATWKAKYKEYCKPLVPGFSHIPFNNAEALRNAIRKDTAAFIVEPIQGESGVIIPDNGYLKEVREICSEKGVLLILDEVQSGMGRTGKFFAYQHERIKPDIVAVSKGLANGLPMGATIAIEGIDFEKGDQGSTGGGNALCSATALKTIEMILKGKLMENAAEKGSYLMKKIKGTRGKGLMIGVMTNDAGKKVLQTMEKGLLVNNCNDLVIRMLPPLIAGKKECDYAIAVLGELL